MFYSLKPNDYEKNEVILRSTDIDEIVQVCADTLRAELECREYKMEALGQWNGSAQLLVGLWVLLTEVPMLPDEEGRVLPLVTTDCMTTDQLLQFAKLLGMDSIKGVRELRRRSREERTGIKRLVELMGGKLR
ncbi:MAG: hypothetical protein ACRDDZ_08770 [Marinifilaceae bacterium]